MSGDAFFRDAMHLLGANLHFERLATVNDCGVQRLIEIRPRHGDVILEAAGNGSPNVVDHAERGVTIAFRVGNDANSEKIVNLFEAALLALQLAVQRTQAFHASFEFGGNSVFHKLWSESRFALHREICDEAALGR